MNSVESHLRSLSTSSSDSNKRKLEVKKSERNLQKKIRYTDPQTEDPIVNDTKTEEVKSNF